MAYNLPPAWDPGFVLPKNVADEGLERRAFVTKWLPRGTYDDSTDGTAGYMVPQYVKDEGIGQGAFTTFWQPRGTYNGPRIPHWLNQRPAVTKVVPLPGGGQQVTVQPMGDDAPLPQRYQDYGALAAQALLARVSILPPSKRAATLRVLMDTVDKSLWKRTQDIFNRYVREQKMAPSDAFPLALARAMSAGIAAEIITTGLRGSAPQARSLLGLGCYGCMAALGADPVADLDQVYLSLIAKTAAGSGTQPSTTTPPTTGQTTPTVDLSQLPLCPAPTGMSWVWDTADHKAGHWERTARGKVDVPGPCDPSTGKTTVPQTNRGGSAITYSDGTTDHQALQIGPFSFPAHVTKTWSNYATEPDLIISHPENIPDDWVAWIHQLLTQTKDAAGNTDSMRTDYYGPSAAAAYGFPETDAGPWLQRLGLSPGVTPVRLHNMWGLRVGMVPFAKLKHPTSGENLSLHTVLNRRDHTKPWDASTNPLVLRVYLSRVPDPGIWGAIWNGLFTVIGVIRDAVVEGLQDLGELACQAFGGVAGQAAGAAAAAAAGAPPQAGAAGASIAQQACKQPPPPPIVAAPSILPMVLLAGGAVLAVALLTKKKKKP